MLVYFALGNAKFWRRVPCPTPTPDARYFAFWWNIGFNFSFCFDGQHVNHNDVHYTKRCEHYIFVQLVFYAPGIKRLIEQICDCFQGVNPCRRSLPAGSYFLVLTHADSALQNTSLDGYLCEIEGDPLHQLITQDLRGNVLAINNSAETFYEQQKQQETILRGIAAAKAQRTATGFWEW